MKRGNDFVIGIIVGFAICLFICILIMMSIKTNAAVPTDVEQAIQDNETTELTEVEIDILAHLVKAEAGNQTMLGKQLVVDVVFNRMRSDRFPNTVEGVIYAQGQFACSGYFMKKKPSEQDYEAVYLEMKKRQNKEVMYFRTKHYGSGTPLFKEDDHYFSGL